jgi:hypothetical protein
MPATQSAYEWLRSRTTPKRRPEPGEPVIGAPVRERDARAEIDNLLGEIEGLVSTSNAAAPRATIDSALASVAQLQVVTANLDACNPPKGVQYGRDLVTFADRRLSGHADAIERGMTYTADNTIRLLRGD